MGPVSMRLRWICCALFLLLAAAPSSAQQPEAAPATKPAKSVKPAPAKPARVPRALKNYLGREIATTMHFTGAPWLTRDSREREEECSTLIKGLNVRPGQVVCDMGCGNGFYTLELARLVGAEGKVLAVDIQPEMLHLLRERAKEQQIEHIELIRGTPVDPRLPDGAVDLILCVDVYHEFSHPEQMLAAMRKSLKPDGRLVLVEFRLEDPDVPIKLLHKMSKEQANKELAANGFKLVEQFDKLPWQHVLFYGRDEQADKAGEDAASN